MTAPVVLVLVLDEVLLLHDRECRSALSVLADHVPAGSRRVLAGRDEPPWPPWLAWPGRICCRCRWTAGALVPLPSPVPRHAAGRAGTPRARRHRLRYC
jgi:hypothetical protein